MPSTPVAEWSLLGVEWPTLLVALAVYGGWFALTRWHDRLPGPVLALAGAWLVAWHGSLQHETIHGHPTRSPLANAAIGFPPLSLWLPYALYRRSHLAHHASPWITHPVHDPESRYLADDGRAWGWIGTLQSTLVGRLAVGPAVAVAALLREEAGRLRRTPLAAARDWLPHLAAVAMVVAWLEWTGLGVVRYALLVVYPATALTLLRSFVEHRADLPGPARAATVGRGGLLGLLYLNNNLHAAHHERPGLPWYRLPALQRRRASGGAAHGYRGYGEIVRRFAFAPHDVLLHPGREAAE